LVELPNPARLLLPQERGDLIIERAQATTALSGGPRQRFHIFRRELFAEDQRGGGIDIELCRREVGRLP
jgi:hypothetical protein